MGDKNESIALRKKRELQGGRGRGERSNCPLIAYKRNTTRSVRMKLCR